MLTYSCSILTNVPNQVSVGSGSVVKKNLKGSKYTFEEIIIEHSKTVKETINQLLQKIQ
jgi:hypothetical protein